MHVVGLLLIFIIEAMQKERSLTWTDLMSVESKTVDTTEIVQGIGTETDSIAPVIFELRLSSFLESRNR